MRSGDPGSVVRAFAPLRELMGITRVADVTGLDRIGLPVFVAVRPNSRSVATSQGKGLTADAARAGALMEAAETWHAERVDLPLRLASADELPGRVIALERLPLRAGSMLDPGRVTLWLQGRTLHGAAVWLPYELVHTDYRLLQQPTLGCFLVGTNGLAAGATRADALCHALCELAERDALAIWIRSGRSSLPLALESVDDLPCRALLSQLEARDFAVVLVEITSDLEVPAWLAAIVDQADPLGHAGLGSACHPDARTARLLALMEAVQVRTSYIAGARDDLQPEEFATHGRLAKLNWIRDLLSLPSRQEVACAGSEAGPEAHDRLEFLLHRLGARGLGEPVVVDLDRPEIGVPVVRVLVPGLEGAGDDPGYVPGARALAMRST